MKGKVRITNETYIWKNEDEEGVIYYKDGKKHKEDGPAVELKDGTRQWFIDGNLHREDGPAAELDSGTKQWWLYGKLHRDDGPAVESADGSRTWFINGKMHREDGPAFEGSAGGKNWFLNGIELTEEEFKHWLDKKNLKQKLESTLEPRSTEKRSKI